MLKKDGVNENNSQMEVLRRQMVDLRSKLVDMKGELPVLNNGPYLSTILGSNLNLSLLNKDARYRYKEEYEKFKLFVTYTILFVFIAASILPSRVIDFVGNFLLVWYYCTLTIREAVLKINGSRIKGWWIMHHYVSCFLCGITLTWKDGECYQEFRPQFILFVLYLSVTQVFQSQYQKGCLRRLHALGQRHSMDITVEGFSSWMFKGLTFLIPFLFVAYLFQFYNAYVLFTLYQTHKCTGQWQVLMLSFLFCFVAVANVFTLVRVMINKAKESGSYSTILGLQTKYRSKRAKADTSE
ncbi:hypothetical protein AB6A40_006321 [Gnathostoma spinigerum]|uniref:Transmembrane protein 120A n=1 Tax=Gnathostoma spinigerum TaxID=75299 RepID=A0ABD6ESV0_9BILA